MGGIRLQHVAVTFPPGGEGALRAFYGGVLELTEMALPAGLPPDLGWIWFATRDDGVELHFIPDPAPPDATRRHHFCLEVDRLDEVGARLAAAGVGVTQPGTPIPGRARLFCRDPFGNLVELVEM